MIANIPPRKQSHPHIEGFLVPQAYKHLAIYKTRPLFRSALPLLALTAISAGIFTTQLIQASKLKAEALNTQNLVTQESQKLIVQNATFKQTRDKLKELEKLKQQIRIPTAPILDAIEKTIPNPVAITKLSIYCPPTASTATTPRKATVTLETYFPDNVSPSEEMYQKWPQTISAHLIRSGLIVSNSEWSILRKYISNPNNSSASSKSKETQGRVKELVLTIELSQADPK